MNQNFTNGNVVNLPPIVTRHVNVVHRYQIINHPHIMEDVTQICNHVIKRHQCITKPICCENTDYQEEGCCGNQMFNNQTFDNQENFFQNQNNQNTLF